VQHEARAVRGIDDLAALETQQVLSREQIDLFAPPPAAEAPAPTPLEQAIATLDPDALSPREALDALYTLKKLGDKK
jgi:DNA mismatch repair protein MutS